MGSRLLNYLLSFIILVGFASCTQEKEPESPELILLGDHQSYFSNYGLLKKPMKFSIPLSQSKEDLVLLIENPHINKITLNFSKRDSALILGDYLNFKARPINFRQFAIPIPALEKPDTLLLELDKSEENLSIGLKILSEEAFLEYQKQDNRLIGFIFGIYLLVILIGLILMPRILSKQAIFFLLYIFLSFCWLLNDSGLFFQYLWPGNPLFHSLSRGFFSATSMVAFAFYVYQNKNERVNSTIKKVFVALVIFIVFKLVFTFLLSFRIFDEFVKGYYLSVNSITLLMLFGILLILLSKEFSKRGDSFFELASIFVYCAFVFSQALAELGITLIRIPFLHQFDTLVFLGIQLFFMMVHIKQEETKEKLKSIHEFSDFQIAQERLLKNRIIEVEEFERKRIAQNIHDEIGSVFASMKYLILSIDEKWRMKKDPIDFIPLLHILDEGVKNQYSIIDDLLSKFDQGESLELAIKRKIEAIFSKSEVKFEVLFSLKEATLTNHQKMQLYRILTELITNTIKHARGTSCISIQIKDTNPIEVSYSDDGKGTKSVVNTNGKGLENIKFRIDQLQGTIRNMNMIDGFTLEFYIPRMYEENINLPDR